MNVWFKRACALMMMCNLAYADYGALELVHPGELRVATEASCPPYSMIDAKGQLDGLDYRLFTEIAKRLGLIYKPLVVKWDSILLGLEAGQYDVVSTPVDITPERQKRILFANGWLESGGKLLTRKDSAAFSPKDLKGKKIGVLVASTWETLAKSYGADTIHTYKSIAEGIQDLTNGNIDGMILDGLEAAYAAKSAPVPLRVSEDFLNRVQKGWAMRMDKPNLVRALNKALKELMEDGTYEKVVLDLVGFDPRPAQPIQTIFPEDKK